MRSYIVGEKPGTGWYRGAVGAIALAAGLGVWPMWGQQNPQDVPTATVEQPPDGPPPDSAQQGPPPTDQGPAPTYEEVPRTMTLGAGTVITVRTSQLLTSDQNRPGDGFTAELQQPMVVHGWVVARRGQTVLGRVAVAQKAGRVKGVSQLGVELTQLVLVDGQQLPIRTQLMQASGGTTNGRDAVAVGTTTGLGAAIGAAAHGGEGAGIGAAIGAGAGLAGVLLTRGRPTVIPPETILTFELEFPVSFSTERSHVAFRPVGPEDYQANHLQRRTERFAGAPYPYPPPPPPYYWGYGPWPYYYPGPAFFGFNYYRFGGHGGYYRHGGHYRR